tara:strand:- start:5908 stop:6480 length:573 start_codon:yes stop_codon:yes gene_type:complete
VGRNLFVTAKIKVAFYKAKGNWFNSIIRWWTKSKYSHAELVLPNNVTWIGISPFLTSTVESRFHLDCDYNNWDFVELEITNKQHATILDFFEETKGCRYDWVGMLLSQFLPFSIKRRSKWYCSEWIAYALRVSGALDWQTIKIYDQSDLSPGTLYKIILKQKRKNNDIRKSTENMEDPRNLQYLPRRFRD